MTKLTRIAAAVLGLTLGAVGAHAQQAAPQPLTVAAVNRTAAAEAARGAPRSDAAVRGGDIVQYQLTFTNTTARPVRGVVLSNPVPTGFRFVEGSSAASRGDARAEFSADGGRSYSTLPMEEVIIDGARVRRPIPTDRYTHVRWTVDGWVAPNSTVRAEFNTRLAAAPRAASNVAARAANPGTR